MNIIAHRGFSAKYHDNTLPAFEAICNHPLYPARITGIECDVQLTSDEKIPVLHDTILTDTSGKRHNVAQLSFRDTNRLLKDLHGDSYPGLTDLQSLLSLVNHSAELTIEIKTGTYDLRRFKEIFKQHLTAYTPAGDITLSSFSFDILEYLRRHLEGMSLRYAYIFQSEDALQSVPSGVRSRFDLLHPHFHLPITKPHIFTTDTPIRCWTVNDETTTRALTACAQHLPVEAIMTDNPEAAEQYLQRMHGSNFALQ